jgi:hypothetical protein
VGGTSPPVTAEPDLFELAGDFIATQFARGNPWHRAAGPGGGRFTSRGMGTYDADMGVPDAADALARLRTAEGTRSAFMSENIGQIRAKAYQREIASAANERQKLQHMGIEAQVRAPKPQVKPAKEMTVGELKAHLASSHGRKGLGGRWTRKELIQYHEGLRGSRSAPHAHGFPPAKFKSGDRVIWRLNGRAYPATVVGEPSRFSRTKEPWHYHIKLDKTPATARMTWTDRWPGESRLQRAPSDLLPRSGEVQAQVRNGVPQPIPVGRAGPQWRGGVTPAEATAASIQTRRRDIRSLKPAQRDAYSRLLEGGASHEDALARAKRVRGSPVPQVSPGVEPHTHESATHPSDEFASDRTEFEGHMVSVHHDKQVETGPRLSMKQLRARHDAQHTRPGARGTASTRAAGTRFAQGTPATRGGVGPPVSKWSDSQLAAGRRDVAPDSAMGRKIAAETSRRASVTSRAKSPKQLRTPAERAAYERLLGRGVSKQEARDVIARRRMTPSQVRAYRGYLKAGYKPAQAVRLTMGF